MTAPRFEPVPPAAGPRVQGFAGRDFLLDGRSYPALLLTPEAAFPWQPPALEALAAADVAPVLALDPPPEFLILGTGAAMAFPPRAFVAALEDQGIGVEPMDSRAAARTWGLLRGEGRWLAAALMPL
ncbi:MAG: Mth938-like domain-containing protein [Sphingomonadaceae bacterium]|nr:Mth938-like domain-containing protein [Sphingomonadaceae bacterium]